MLKIGSFLAKMCNCVQEHRDPRAAAQTAEASSQRADACEHQEEKAQILHITRAMSVEGKIKLVGTRDV